MLLFLPPLPPSRSFFVVHLENGYPLFYYLIVQPPLWFEMTNLQRTVTSIKMHHKHLNPHSRNLQCYIFLYKESVVLQ